MKQSLIQLDAINFFYRILDGDAYGLTDSFQYLEGRLFAFQMYRLKCYSPSVHDSYIYTILVSSYATLNFNFANMKKIIVFLGLGFMMSCYSIRFKENDNDPSIAFYSNEKVNIFLSSNLENSAEITLLKKYK